MSAPETVAARPAAPAASVPDLHMGNIAPFACKRLGLLGAIVLASNADGSIGLSAHGVNHARANEMLSVGVYMNLQQHYDAIRAGAAGAEAKEHIDALDHFERKQEPRSPHQARVITEKADLDTKAKALSDFIGLNPIFETLPAAEQERLKEQCEVMWKYSEILGQRIAEFKEMVQ